VKGITNPGILWKLFQLSRDVKKIGEIYDNYPSDPIKLSEWRQGRNKFLGEDL
jgi:hypothetical protein